MKEGADLPSMDAQTNDPLADTGLLQAVDEWRGVPLHAISPAVLAYIGDAVYELYIRMRVLRRQYQKVNALHQATVTRVKADAQVQVLAYMEPFLTESEKDMVRRGRNNKSGSSTRGSSVMVYRNSTAFETLLGYLYLTRQEARMMELLETALTKMEAEPVAGE